MMICGVCGHCGVVLCFPFASFPVFFIIYVCCARRFCCFTEEKREDIHIDTVDTLIVFSDIGLMHSIEKEEDFLRKQVQFAADKALAIGKKLKAVMEEKNLMKQQHEQDISSLMNRLASTEKSYAIEIQRLTKENENWKANYEKLKLESKNREEEAERLSQKMKTDCLSLIDSCEKLGAKCKDLKSENTALKERIKQRTDKSNKIIEHYKQKLSLLEEQLSELSSQLSFQSFIPPHTQPPPLTHSPPKSIPHTSSTSSFPVVSNENPSTSTIRAAIQSTLSHHHQHPSPIYPSCSHADIEKKAPPSLKIFQKSFQLAPPSTNPIPSSTHPTLPSEAHPVPSHDHPTTTHPAARVSVLPSFLPSDRQSTLTTTCSSRLSASQLESRKYGSRLIAAFTKEDLELNSVDEKECEQKGYRGEEWSRFTSPEECFPQTQDDEKKNPATMTTFAPVSASQAPKRLEELTKIHQSMTRRREEESADRRRMEEKNEQKERREKTEKVINKGPKSWIDILNEENPKLEFLSTSAPTQPRTLSWDIFDEKKKSYHQELQRADQLLGFSFP